MFLMLFTCYEQLIYSAYLASQNLEYELTFVKHIALCQYIVTVHC